MTKKGYKNYAINPLRQDLLDKVKGTDLVIKTIQELKDEAEKICGTPAKAQFEDEIVAVIKWVDGTVIDCVRKMVK